VARTVYRHYAADHPWLTPEPQPGTLHWVAIDVSGTPYVDLEREAAAMLSRE